MMNLKEKRNGMNRALKPYKANCAAMPEMISNAAIAEEGNAKGSYVDRQTCS
jgi:hypothetical protein